MGEGGLVVKGATPLLLEEWQYALSKMNRQKSKWQGVLKVLLQQHRELQAALREVVQKTDGQLSY